MLPVCAEGAQDAELPERKRTPGQLPRSTFVPHGVRLSEATRGSAPPSPSPSTRSAREDLGGRDFVMVRTHVCAASLLHWAHPLSGSLRTHPPLAPGVFTDVKGKKNCPASTPLRIRALRELERVRVHSRAKAHLGQLGSLCFEPLARTLSVCPKTPVWVFVLYSAQLVTARPRGRPPARRTNVGKGASCPSRRDARRTERGLFVSISGEQGGGLTAEDGVQAQEGDAQDLRCAGGGRAFGLWARPGVPAGALCFYHDCPEFTREPQVRGVIFQRASLNGREPGTRSQVRKAELQEEEARKQRELDEVT